MINIGSGPAGLTAGIYTARANLAPLIIEGEPSSTSDQPGGQLMLTTEVENFPGFPDGIMGPELMGRMRAQAVRFGAEFITDKATRVELAAAGEHRVFVRDTEHRARAVIVSTGAQSTMLGLPEEQRLLGHGLSTCATGDGFFFRDQHIAVVGGGDSAVEEALFLTKFASNVTIIHRRDQLRASRIMADRAVANDRIEFAWNSRVTAIAGDDRVEGVRLVDTVTGTESAPGHRAVRRHRTPTQHVTVRRAARHRPRRLPHHPGGGSTLTNVAGVFACGDVQDHTYRQAITAAGSGCMAAIDAERWLEAAAHA